MTRNKCFFVLSGPIFRGSPSAIKVHVRSKASEHSSPHYQQMFNLCHFYLNETFEYVSHSMRKLLKFVVLPKSAATSSDNLDLKQFSTHFCLWKLILHNMHIIQTTVSVLSTGYTSSVFRLNSPNTLCNISN